MESSKLNIATDCLHFLIVIVIRQVFYWLDKGEEKEKRTGFQIKRLKVVQEPNKPIAYVHHPVQIPAVLRNAEFDTGTELGSIYNKFKERAKERHGEIQSSFRF